MDASRHTLDDPDVIVRQRDGSIDRIPPGDGFHIDDRGNTNRCYMVLIKSVISSLESVFVEKCIDKILYSV